MPNKSKYSDDSSTWCDTDVSNTEGSRLLSPLDPPKLHLELSSPAPVVRHAPRYKRRPMHKYLTPINSVTLSLRQNDDTPVRLNGHHGENDPWTRVNRVRPPKPLRCKRILAKLQPVNKGYHATPFEDPLWVKLRIRERELGL
mmetsp:Transcript_4922/g.7506  ORF Transcript_4922/g.7506 Transcript_4922/m.7506 type:complete len:143 (+) Transcript_4922:209-637(+)